MDETNSSRALVEHRSGRSLPAAPSHARPSAPPPPATPRHEVVEMVGARRIVDPYRWLENPDEPEVVRWSQAQQTYFLAARSQWADLPRFRSRLDALTAFEDCRPPAWAGPYAFFQCQDPTGDQPSLRVREYAADGVPSGPERIILDPMALDESGRTTLDAWSASPDGRYVAYQLSAGGTEESLLRVADAADGSILDGPIPGCRYADVAWLPGRTPDRPAFVYVRIAPGREAPSVWRHEVGANAETDFEVFDGAGRYADLGLALDSAGRRLVVTGFPEDEDATEIWVVDGPDSEGPAGPRARRLEVCEGSWSAGWPRHGLLFLLTDHDAARGRVVVVDPDVPGSERELIGEDPQSVLEAFALLDEPGSGRAQIAALRTQRGRSAITIHDALSGERVAQVPLPGRGIVRDLVSRAGGGHELWFTYTDTLTPPTVYRHDAVKRTTTPWRTAPAIRPTGVSEAEVEYTSTDGTRVRLLLTIPEHATREDADGPLPTILHGYGAFGEAQVADYYELALAWAEAGGLYAVACVRGGGEEGEAWHEGGMGAHKQQGIDDFLAAARYLISSGRTEPRMLACRGFSAGGLLAAAAFTQRPELFAAAECTSPLLDMARYELTGLGPLWTAEFGSREVPEELDRLLDYSPYHRTAPGTAYPAVLLATFDGDTRVDPMHARKLCAALQHASTSGRPILLRTEPGVGHGERSRSARLDYYADVLAFLSDSLGLAPRPAN